MMPLMTRACATITVAGLFGAAVLLQGCSGKGGEPYTLYRNSPFEAGERVHWATFDAKQSDPLYNANNCEMAARLLNANYAASAKAEGKQPAAGVGFWCEEGAYKAQGAVPASFPAAFPTDT
jgi:hypothetical protein